MFLEIEALIKQLTCFFMIMDQAFYPLLLALTLIVANCAIRLNELLWVF